MRNEMEIQAFTMYFEINKIIIFTRDYYTRINILIPIYIYTFQFKRFYIYLFKK